MKKSLLVYGISILVVLVFSLLANQGGTSYDLMTFFGLGNLVLGALFLIVSVFYALVQRGPWAKIFLLAGGFLLLTGLAVCSAYPMKFH